MHIREYEKNQYSPQKFGRERGANLEKCWKNVKIIGFLIFFSNILDKMKGSVGQDV